MPFDGEPVETAVVHAESVNTPYVTEPVASDGSPTIRSAIEITVLGLKVVKHSGVTPFVVAVRALV